MCSSYYVWNNVTILLVSFCLKDFIYYKMCFTKRIKLILCRALLLACLCTFA